MSDGSEDNSPPRDGDSAAGPELPDRLTDKLRISIPGYELLQTIGFGGQATVYRALDKARDRVVAVKVLHGGAYAHDAARERLRRETVALRAIDHPNIVSVVDAGTTPLGMDYLVMDYVDGRRLDALWKDAAFAGAIAPDPLSRLRVFQRICDVLQTPHLKGITHRDLSPPNILITGDGEPHILDFGLVSTAFNDMLGREGRQVSVTGQFLGNREYAAPEQVRQARSAVDPRTDVYALGIILFQILADGEFPYAVTGDDYDVFTNILTARPRLPREAVAAKQHAPLRGQPGSSSDHPAFHPAMERIVLKALEKDPEKRYHTAGEFGRDIEHYLSGSPAVAIETLPVPARAANAFPPRAKWIALAIVAIAVFAASIQLLHGSQDNHAASTNKKATQIPSPRKPAPIDPTDPPPFSQPADQAQRTFLDDMSGKPRPPEDVNLLAVADLKEDAAYGNWAQTNGGLLDGGPYVSRFRLPYQPPEEYDLNVGFTARMVGQYTEFTLLFPHHGMPGGLYLSKDTAPQVIGCSTAGGGTAANPDFQSGQHYRFLVQVRKDKTRVFLNGKLIVEGIARPGNDDKPALQWYCGDNVIGIGTNWAVLEFDSISVHEIGHAGRFVKLPPLYAIPALSESLPAENPKHTVDLLALADPKSDSLEGQWVMDGGKLRQVANDAALHPGSAWRFRFPYHPPQEYNYRVTFILDDDAYLCPISCKGDVEFSYEMASYANVACAFGIKKNIYANPTVVYSPAIMTSGRAYAAVIYVRKTYVAASIDGKLISQHATDGSDLSCWKPRSIGGGCLGLSASGQVTILSAQVDEISGSGRLDRD